MDRLLEWYVNIMYSIDKFFRPDHYEQRESWVRRCHIAGLDPFNPFPEEES